MAFGCPMLYRDRAVREEWEKERVYQLEFGFRRDRLPGRSEDLSMEVGRVGEKPLMLLTNIMVKGSRKELRGWWRVI